METYRKIFEQVLKKIKPTTAQQKTNKKIVNEVTGKLRKFINKDVKICMVGSFAKGTHIMSKKEFDIFLLFPKTYSKKQISDLCIAWGRKAFKRHRLAYAEHAYIKLKHKTYQIDLVPAYRIARASEKATSVDRSPFHTIYVNKKLKQSRKDDVRILKQFFKAQNIYGAELRVEGFSGYLAELLIINYGGIINLFKATEEWTIPVVIDIETHGTEQKFNTPMIVIDPVDMNRNVAAVVSATSLSRFIFYARRFLHNPSLHLFFPEKKKATRKRLLNIIRDRKTSLNIYEFDAPDVVEDILWPQLKRTVYSLKNRFKELEFRFMGMYYWSDGIKCVVMFETYGNTLPGIVKITGPVVTSPANIEKFMEKHKRALDMQVVHDKLMIINKRNFVGFDHAFRHAVNDPCVGMPDRFRALLKKSTKLSVQMFVKKYPQIAQDYFTRTIKHQ
jgi:tRNA nucleotidyltransferase (CCA-adding enzyme)